MTLPTPVTQLVTFVDVDRMRRIWRAAVPKTFWNLLDAKFEAGESMEFKPVPMFQIGVVPDGVDLLPEDIELGFWMFAEQEEARFKYIWNAGLQRYTYSNGRVVPVATLHDLIERIEINAGPKMRRASMKLIKGTIDVVQWENLMRQAIKDSHVLAGVAARGGWQQMSFADWGYTGSLVKKQYRYLDRFADDIISGRQALDGRLLVRADAFAKTAYHDFEDMRRRIAQQSGLFNEERRILGGSDPCVDCDSYHAEGWRPIGTMPTIGESKCVFNCRCHFEFRFNPELLVWDNVGSDDGSGFGQPPPSAFGG